jgi:hypothetical protein
MRKGILLVGAAAALALPLGACGDDDNEKLTGTEEEIVAKSDFIQSANAACEKRSEEMSAKAEKVVAKFSTQPDSEKGRREVIEKAIAPGFEAEVKDLRALKPPPGDEEEVEEVIRAIEEMVARTKEDLGAGRVYPYRRTENLAAAYGLPACGHP